MDISIQLLQDELADYECPHYNIYVDGNRILTSVASTNYSAEKWIKQALKIVRNTKLPNTIVVGVAAASAPGKYVNIFDRKVVKNPEYDVLQLCIGSNCLLYFLPKGCYGYETSPKFLINFFANPKVVAVGMKMKKVAEVLDRDYDIKVKNPVDLNELAEEGMNRDDLDLGRYDLDKLAKAVLGKRFDVERPQTVEEWMIRSWSPVYYELIDPDFVKFSTVDPYLCFLMGAQLLETIHVEKKSENKKKKKLVDKKGKKK